jgi:uncharacterized membrane protein YeaQ/YmgE (transglycosylase-associated protein family)
MGLLISLLVGLIAGALAGQFVKGRGFGLVGDTIVGLVGGLLGGLLFGSLGLNSNDGILNAIVVSFIGAVVFLIIIKALVKSY